MSGFFNKLGMDRQISFFQQLVFGLTGISSIEAFMSIMMIPAVGCYIQGNINDEIRSVIENRSDRSSEELIRFVSSVYIKICDAADSISKFTSSILLLNLLLVCFFNVFNAYTVFVFLKLGGSDMMYFSLLSSSWAVGYIPPVIWIIKCSSVLQKQSIETLSLISQLTTTQRTSKALKSSRNLDLLLSHRRPKISCGSLTLNWPFLFSLIGCIFSFSIIVIQFSDV
jgi:7tm Chemosensory receptor